MIYNMLSHLIAFLATIHIVAKDLAFSSPLNDPPRGQIEYIKDYLAKPIAHWKDKLRRRIITPI